MSTSEDEEMSNGPNIHSTEHSPENEHNDRSYYYNLYKIHKIKIMLNDHP